MAQEGWNSKSGRGDNRRRTLFGGVLFDNHDKKWDCKVSNISETGVLVKTGADLKVGTFVELKIIKLNDFRRAEVMWVNGNKFGLHFVVKIKKSDPEMAELFKLMKKSHAP